MLEGGCFEESRLAEIEELGEQLSEAIGCDLTYSARGAKTFECKCGISFPWKLIEDRNWKLARWMHERPCQRRTNKGKFDGYR